MNLNKEIKTILVVSLIAVLLTVAGILLLKAAQAPVAQTPSLPAPAPQPQVSDTEGWQTYRNDEFGFELKYPAELSVNAEGPNDIQQALEKGEQVSGTVAPSLETINFTDSTDNSKLSIDIFAETNAEFSENGYRDGYLYVLGPCDLRWDFEPFTIEEKEISGRSALLVQGNFRYHPLTLEHGFLTCVYLKTKADNLLVMHSEDFDILNQILSTFRFVDKSELPESKRGYKREKLFSYVDYIPDRSAYEYDAMDSDLRFSPDGKHFAIYPFRDDYISGKVTLIVDGKRIGSYEEIPGDEVEPFVKFSPDSKEIAYVAQMGGESFVVWDNQPGKQYQQAGYTSGDSSIAGLSLEFSPDGKHLAYTVFDGTEEDFIKRKGSFFVVFDGKEGKHYDDIVSDIVFSPDSTHFAYVANEGCVFEFIGYTGDRGNCYGGKTFVVKDDVEQPERHDFINILKFSPDGEIVYAGSDGCPYAGGQGWGCDEEQKFFVVFQEKKLEISGRPYLLEISSKRELAYVIEDVHTTLVWSGKSKQYPDASISSLKFPPDGNRFAYVVDPDYIYGVSREDQKKDFVVLDGQEKQGSYDNIWSPLFSPDSKHFAYIGGQGGQGRRYSGSRVYEGSQTVVLDGQPLKSPDGMEYARIQNLRFSEDGSSLFYNARSGDSWYYIEELVE